MSNKKDILILKIKNADHTYWAGIAFFIVILMFIAYLTHKMSLKLMSAQDMPISTLQIIGVRPYSNDLDIHHVLQELSESESFFSLDVNEVQKKLEDIAWIKRVAVRRKWPNGLIIHVTDQVPIAYWNDEYLLNDNGEIFKAQKDRLTNWLPQFFGPDEVSKKVLIGYQALWPLFDSEGFTLSEIMLTQRQSWNITLNNGGKLVLGRGNDVIRNMRIERFLKVYKHIMPQVNDINYVDLRYDAGFAVNWKKQSGVKAQNEQG